MNSFVQRHAQSVTGILSGWDRLRFRGTLRMLANVEGMRRFLSYTGCLLKDFGAFALQSSRGIREASLGVAEALDRPVVHLSSPSICKEEQARRIAMRDGIREGLICVLTAVESCGGYDIRSDRQSGHLKLVHAPRKCQHLYHYYLHPVFGFMHVRLQTWLPFNLFPCINGREWLGKQMDSAGIAYERRDNCFTEVSDVAAAQTLLEEQVRFNYEQALGALAAAVNPGYRQFVGDWDVDYYWSLEESEWATDVMFKSAGALSGVYPALVRHGMYGLRSPDVLRFLGQPLGRGGQVHPRNAQEIASDVKRRAEGVRVKHRAGGNSVKMYDKQQSVLRVETTLNNMRQLKAPTVVEGKVVWRKMKKGVCDIARRAEVSQASNERYLEAVSSVECPLPLKTLTESLGRRVIWHGRAARGLNLLGDDARLLEAVAGGEFLINGFRNRDVQAALYGQQPKDAAEKRRRCGRVTRQLRLLRAHGLIQKVPRSHRYLVSKKGRQVISALQAAREADVNKLLNAA